MLTTLPRGSRLHCYCTAQTLVIFTDSPIPCTPPLAPQLPDLHHPSPLPPPSVREGAINLLGKHMAQDADVASSFLSTVARAMATDPGVSVRRRAIAVLADTCVLAAGFPRAAGEDLVFVDSTWREKGRQVLSTRQPATAHDLVSPALPHPSLPPIPHHPQPTPHPRGRGVDFPPGE